MTALELDVYAKVVHALAQITDKFQTSDVFPNAKEPPPYFYTWRTSLLEWSAEYLWKLGILRSLEETNGFGSLFKFDCSLTDVPTIAKKNAAGGPTLDDLVWLYIELRSEYSSIHRDGSTQFLTDGKQTSRLAKKKSRHSRR